MTNDDDDRRTRPMRAVVPPVIAFNPGDQIGPWVLGERLGGGGFGAVYATQHRERGTHAALKILHAHFTTSPEILGRFEREIQVLSRMQHPNVVRVLDAGFGPGGRPYLAMDRLGGNDLGAILRARKPLPLADVYRILEPVADALAAAHQLGVIHRDIKAANVFVCDDGRIMLLDFGIAKISDALAPELTTTQQSLGTPGCMAPEQIQGVRVDARTDVYALGGLIFHLLTGKLPFDDISETMTQYLHLHARRPRASALVAQIPPAIDDVIVRAMAIQPGSRFPTTRALFDAFRDAYREMSSTAAPATIEHAAIYVTFADTSAGHDLDEALLADLEAVLPTVERALAEHGFVLALDLGTSAMFVAPLHTVPDPARVALAAWEELSKRASRDPRVRAGLGVHRGLATVVGNRVEPCALLRVDTWGLPDPLDGTWVTATLAPAVQCLAR